MRTSWEQSQADDAAVLAAVRVGYRRLQDIAYAIESLWHHIRRVDRALQRLRQRGEIFFDPQVGWMVSSAKQSVAK